MAWAAAIRSASCSSSSSRFWGFPGNMSPNCSMNCSKLGSMGSPASRCSSILLSALMPSRMCWSWAGSGEDIASDMPSK